MRITANFGPVTFAQLPSNPTAGVTAYITNSSTNVLGVSITGTGANPVLAWYNGTMWTVVGK